MLTDELKTTIQRAYSLYLENKGYTARRGQLMMIAEIARNVAAAQEIEQGAAPATVIEAGTGVGKTIAYLISAIPVAQARDKKLIISTATVALQEQILLKDLPDLRKNSDLKFSFALAKGRGRYLCTAKLIALLGGQEGSSQGTLFGDQGGVQLDRYSYKRYEKMKDAFVAGKWDGDRDNWQEGVRDNEWRSITATHHECSGRRCQFIDQCSFYAARKDVQTADCIVANHDLVLSDLALGGGVVLPSPEDSIYIFDEGHHLSEKSIQHFANSTRIKNSLSWLKQIMQELPQCAQQIGWQKNDLHTLGELGDLAKGLHASLMVSEPMWEQLLEGSAASKVNDDGYRFPEGAVPSEVKEVAGSLSTPCLAMAQKFDELLSSLKKIAEDKSQEALSARVEQWQALLGANYYRAEVSYALWARYAHADDAAKPPHARWLKRIESQGVSDIEVCSSPIIAAEVLDQYLWRRCFSVVITSATLSVGGDFDRFKMQTGVSEGSHFCLFDSPFDYQNAGLLVVPGLACDPSDVEAHTQAIVDYIHQDVSVDQGTLVLFSSRRQMEAVYEEMSSVYQDLALVQGEQSKQLIIQDHRERVDEGGGSIIFGLASFAEGIDLPGRYLDHVVIARIPFSVPTEPAAAALFEWLEGEGRNPFIEVSVPDAAMRLIQACGRLLRSEEDSGRIALLDRRIVSRRYGQSILAALPPFRRQVVAPVKSLL